MGPPRGKAGEHETEETHDRRPLEPWENAAFRVMVDERAHRKWLRSVMWKVLGWGGAFVVLFSSIKDEISAWLSSGGGSP
jgi:hypothetical protein